jgi:hypothetical protein
LLANLLDLDARPRAPQRPAGYAESMRRIDAGLGPLGELADVGRTALAWLGVRAPGALAGPDPLPAPPLSRPRT